VEPSGRQPSDSAEASTEARELGGSAPPGADEITQQHRTGMMTAAVIFAVLMLVLVSSNGRDDIERSLVMSVLFAAGIGTVIARRRPRVQSDQPYSSPAPAPDLSVQTFDSSHNPQWSSADGSWGARPPGYQPAQSNEGWKYIAIAMGTGFALTSLLIIFVVGYFIFGMVYTVLTMPVDSDH
jgi:hypothetical protein